MNTPKPLDPELGTHTERVALTDPNQSPSPSAVPLQPQPVPVQNRPPMSFRASKFPKNADKSEFKNKTLLFRSELKSERQREEQELINEPVCYTVVRFASRRAAS